MAQMQRSSPCKADAAATAACPGGGLISTLKSCSLCLEGPFRRPLLRPPHPHLRPPIPELSWYIREFECCGHCSSPSVGKSAGTCARWCWLVLNQGLSG